MLKYVFGGLFILVIWAGALSVDSPSRTLGAVCLTAMVVLVLAAIVVAGRGRERQFERALRNPAGSSVRQEFSRAVEALRASAFRDKGGAGALQALPWYVVLGPPGAGKSTILRNCGLRFPYADGTTLDPRRPGLSHWWLSNEAVIVETAGLYATIPHEHKDWLSFLALLRKTRPSRPINGIVCAIAVTDLAGTSPQHVAAYANELRARIDELTRTLETVAPLYLVLTKCDLVPGFGDFFADLGPQERGQLWGFTVPLADRREPAAIFAEYFPELWPSLETRMTIRLVHEGQQPGGGRIYAFPQQVEAMYGPLHAFLGTLLRKSTLEPPRLRGVYFCSAAYGCFLRDLVEPIVLPDRNLATDTRGRRVRELGVRLGFAALFWIASITAVALCVPAYLANRELLLRTEHAVEGVEAHLAVRAQPIAATALVELEALEDSLAVDAGDVPAALRRGMYQGHKYAGQVHELGRVTLRDHTVLPLHRAEADALGEFAARHSGPSSGIPAREHTANAERLRMYLLLTPGAKQERATLAQDERAWLREHLAKVWKSHLRKHGGEASSTEALLPFVETYVEALASEPERMGFARDAKLVRSAKRVLELPKI